MATMRDIKRRKASIESTQQITKAMKLVATVKLQKSRTKAKEQGIDLEDIRLEMSWNTDGYWMPTGAELYLGGGGENMPRLGSIIESELGISREKQKCIIVH